MQTACQAVQHQRGRSNAAICHGKEESPWRSGRPGAYTMQLFGTIITARTGCRLLW
ncbi:DIS3L isoform 8 [Pongo abelii]|uniref:DIS3L isoform 3 n=1 Tax=Pongo abelii TaxID=9601 RepID=A0A2J8T7Z3_PONAB|nr:DIS3L isoform 3 [Pongo abelii]PNJ29133.1 DIS3L isoform 8 [Pongo abelii]